MHQPNPMSLAPIAVAVLLLLAACSGSTGGVSSIDCRLSAGSDGNSDTASIPFEAGELELAVTGLQASIVVTFGERGGWISIDLHTTPSDGASNSVWLGTSSAGFTNDPMPGETIVGGVGETPVGAPYDAHCAAS